MARFGPALATSLLFLSAPAHAEDGPRASTLPSHDDPFFTEPAPPRLVERPSYDPRVPSGVTLGMLGGLMIGAGASNHADTDGQGFGGSLSVGTMIGGATALLGSATMLGYAAIEGGDTPRRAPGKVVAGQVLTGIGFAFTTMFTATLIHGYYEGNPGEFFGYLGLLPGGGVMVAGVPVWLAGARDLELNEEMPTRSMTRSPAMAVMGGLMGVAGLGACGTSLAIMASEEDRNDKAVIMGTLGAVGAVTTSLGATLLIFGATDAEIPPTIPSLSVGPGTVSAQLILD